MAIVEFYDQDKVCIKASFNCLTFIILFQFNKAEFIGRTFAKPHVYLEEDLVRVLLPVLCKTTVSNQDTYQPPSLEWYQIVRGSEEAGDDK